MKTFSSITSRSLILAATIVSAGTSNPAVGPTPADLKDHAAVFEVQPSEISAADEKRHIRSKGIGGERVITIPAAAFGDNGNNPDTYRFYEPGGYIRGANGGGICGMAPVYLPHGATIDELWASVVDNDAAQNIYGFLARVDTTARNTSNSLATLHTSGASTAIQSISNLNIDYPEVDLDRYAYYLMACIDSADTRLYSVRVWYIDPEIFSDSFEIGNSNNWSATVGGAKCLPLGNEEEPDEELIALPLFDQAPPEMREKLREQIKAYGTPLVIPSADFIYDGQFPGEAIDSTAGYLHASDLGSVGVQAPVYLPEGVNVASVWALVRDNDDSCPLADISVKMKRTNNASGVTDEMAAFSSSGADTSYDWILDATPEHTLIEYPDYEYYMSARLCSSEHRLYAALIFYSNFPTS